MPTSTELGQFDLATLRSGLGLSIREIAALTHVSATTALRWERGSSFIPAPARTILDQLAEDGGRTLAETVLKAVGDGGRTVMELRSILATPRQRRELARLIEDGILCLAPVGKTDARGRAYVREGVFRESDGRRRALDRSAPLSRGPVLAQARRAQGLTVEDIAGRVGIAPSTLRCWEAAAPPRARLPQLAKALDEAPSGDQIRRLKDAAGWTLEELARPIGVHPSVVHNWMTGYRPVPAGRKTSLLAALSEADRASRARFRTAVELTELAVAKEPGILVSEFRHRQRICRDGSHRTNPLAERARRIAVREGRIVIADDFRFDSSGRPRTAKRLYPRDQAPKPLEHMTGDQLGVLRSTVGWTQRELARSLGISSASVSIWERRHSSAIPAYWAMRAMGAISNQKKLPHPEKFVRDDILGVIRRTPGIGHWKITEQAGHSKAVARCLATLVAEQAVVEGDACDSRGRKYVGFYPPESPAQPIQRLDGPALRCERIKVGLTAAELGEAIGVRGNTVTRWETGARYCPPARIPAVRAALDEAVGTRHSLATEALGRSH